MADNFRDSVKRYAEKRRETILFEVKTPSVRREKIRRAKAGLHLKQIQSDPRIEEAVRELFRAYRRKHGTEPR